MKAVIVECSNGAAVALCDDGSFRKVKNKGYSIGQELLIQQKATTNHMMQKLSICASLALVLLSCLGIGSYSYVKPYSYVSLDINPSIEYALNRYDKVISVSGINEKGQQVVSSIESDVKNQNITTALDVTIRQLEKENYIMKKEYNHVIVSVCSANDTKAQSIASSVNNLSSETSSVCLIDTMTVSREVKNNADSLGITPAKLALINAVAETTSDSDFDVSAWTELTVRELEHTIQQASSQSPDSEKDPVKVTVIDSNYLSSVLDDNTAYDSDSTTPSVIGANAGNGSATTDKQTSTTNDTTTGSSENETVTNSNQNNTENTATAPADSDQPVIKNDSESDAGKPTVPEEKNDAAVENSGQTGQDISNEKDHSDKNNEDSTSQETLPAETDHGQDIDDTLTEDSSSKKDSYPISSTDGLEDSTNPNPADQETDVDNSLTDEDIDDVVSDAIDAIEDTDESGMTQITDEVSE